jgi:hypothetical protein
VEAAGEAGGADEIRGGKLAVGGFPLASLLCLAGAARCSPFGGGGELADGGGLQEGRRQPFSGRRNACSSRALPHDGGRHRGWPKLDRDKLLARSAGVVAGVRVERLPRYCSGGAGAAAKDDAEEEVAAPCEPTSRNSDSERRRMVKLFGQRKRQCS